jgi:hypothetical protein
MEQIATEVAEQRAQFRAGQAAAEPSVRAEWLPEQGWALAAAAGLLAVVATGLIKKRKPS